MREYRLKPELVSDHRLKPVLLSLRFFAPCDDFCRAQACSKARTGRIANPPDPEGTPASLPHPAPEAECWWLNADGLRRSRAVPPGSTDFSLCLEPGSTDFSLCLERV
jgi:hypothetical protein